MNPKNTSSAINIVVDLGNALLKGMIQGRPNSAVVVPHAVRKFSDTAFNAYLGRIQHGYQRGAKDVDVNAFRYDIKGSNQAVIVGENAEGKDNNRRSGGPKYQADYYPLLFMSILLRLIPQGHENIRVMATFPPGDYRFTENLMNSLGGKHVVTRVDGSQVVYKVRQVFIADEPIGGTRNFMIADNAYRYSRQLPGGLGLCIDIGGKISSIVPFRADGFVDYDEAKSIDLGIQDVMRGISDIMLSTPEFQSYFESERGSVLPFDEEMRKCIRTGVYNAGGYELPVLDAVADATESIRSQLKDIITQDLKGVRRFKYAVITGGGGGALFQQICEHVLNMPSNVIYPAIDDPDKMHLANLFGASKMLGMQLNEGRV